MNKRRSSITYCVLESSSLSLQAKAGLLPASIGKAALKYNLISAAPYCLWLLPVNKAGAWSIAQMVDACLACTEPEVPFLHCLPLALDVAVHTCNGNIQEIQGGGAEVHGYPQIHGKFKASLVYMTVSKIKSSIVTKLSRCNQDLTVSRFQILLSGPSQKTKTIGDPHLRL